MLKVISETLAQWYLMVNAKNMNCALMLQSSWKNVFNMVRII